MAKHRAYLSLLSAKSEVHVSSLVFYYIYIYISLFPADSPRIEMMANQLHSCFLSLLALFLYEASNIMDVHLAVLARTQKKRSFVRFMYVHTAVLVSGRDSSKGTAQTGMYNKLEFAFIV